MIKRIILLFIIIQLLSFNLAYADTVDDLREHLNFRSPELIFDNIKKVNEVVMLEMLSYEKNIVRYTEKTKEYSELSSTIDTQFYNFAYDFKKGKDAENIIKQLKDINENMDLLATYKENDVIIDVSYKEHIVEQEYQIEKEVIIANKPFDIGIAYNIAPPLVMDEFIISSMFGYRIDPFNFTRVSMHRGVDYVATTGTPVTSQWNGTVAYTGNNKSYGKHIVISHGNGLETRYAHLSKVQVTAGQKVRQWQRIGEVGSTGESTGSHLHFEVILDNVLINPVLIHKNGYSILNKFIDQVFIDNLPDMDTIENNLANIYDIIMSPDFVGSRIEIINELDKLLKQKLKENPITELTLEGLSDYERFWTPIIKERSTNEVIIPEGNNVIMAEFEPEYEDKLIYTPIIIPKEFIDNLQLEKIDEEIIEEE